MRVVPRQSEASGCNLCARVVRVATVARGKAEGKGAAWLKLDAVKDQTRERLGGFAAEKGHQRSASGWHVTEHRR